MTVRSMMNKRGIKRILFFYTCLSVLVFCGCKKTSEGEKTQVEPVPRDEDTILVETTIWPRVEGSVSTNCFGVLTYDKALGNRFTSTAESDRIEGAIFVILGDRPQMDIRVSVCKDQDSKLGDIEDTRVATASVNVSLPEDSVFPIIHDAPHDHDNVTRVPFALDCMLDPTTSYWLVIQPELDKRFGYLRVAVDLERHIEHVIRHLDRPRRLQADIYAGYQSGPKMTGDMTQIAFLAELRTCSVTRTGPNSRP